MGAVSLGIDKTHDAIAELETQEYPFIGFARSFRDCEYAFIKPNAVNGISLELIIGGVT